MGGDLLGGLIGTLLGGGDEPKAKASTSAADSIEADSRKATKSRAALFETEGGAAGEELDSTGVKKRSTLLGN